MAPLKKIGLIYTGGTIGGQINNGSKAISEDVARQEFERLVEKRLRRKLDRKHIKRHYLTSIKKLSEQTEPDDWLKIAKDTLNSFNHSNDDGIVIAHGTDTLAYTAAALALFLRNCPGPVILTGANLPIQKKESDGWTNVYHSILAACSPQLKGVFVVFAGVNGGVSDIHLGSRVRKLRAEGNCYASVNIPRVGFIRSKRWRFRDEVRITSPKALNFYHRGWEAESIDMPASFKNRVGFVKLVPGLEPKRLRHQIEEGISALLIEAYGSGTATTADKSHYSLIPTLELAKEKGIPVFLTSQCLSPVKAEAYGSSVHLRKAGVIGLKDMSTEMAFVKLTWATSRTRDRSQIEKLMLKNFAGEIGFR